jgi:hypothetical protein
MTDLTDREALNRVWAEYFKAGYQRHQRRYNSLCYLRAAYCKQVFIRSLIASLIVTMPKQMLLVSSAVYSKNQP